MRSGNDCLLAETDKEIQCNGARDEVGKGGATVREHWRPPGFLFVLFLRHPRVGACKYELTSQPGPGNGAGVCAHSKQRNYTGKSLEAEFLA